MSTWKILSRTLYAAAIIAAVAVVFHAAPKGVDTDIVSLLFPSKGTLLKSLTRNSAKTVNILFEGTNKADVVIAAKNFSLDFHRKHSLKETLAKINKHKDGLISEESRNLIISNRTSEITKTAVASLFGFSAPLFSIQEDPFLLASEYVTSLQSQNTSGWQLEDGLLTKSLGTNFFALISFDCESISPLKILERVDTVNQQSKDVRIWTGGAPVHTAISESSAKKEINILSTISITLCLALGIVLLRTFKFIPFLLVSLICSFSVSAAAIFLCFDRPHALTLVFGTSLIGLSVDYTYHTFASKGKNVVRPLSYALLTTIACFSPLFFSSALILRQMALFTISGLLTMYFAVLLFAFDIKTALTPEIDSPPSTKHDRWTLPAKIVLAICATAGIFNLKTGDDPSKIYKPVPFLLESEKRIAQAGGIGFSRFIAVKGDSIQDALEREEKNGIKGISSVVPSLKTQRENFELKKSLYSKELGKLAKMTGATPFPLPHSPSFLTPADLIGTALERPLKIGIVETEDGVYLTTPTSETRQFDDDNISIIEPRKIISNAFDSYTVETVKLISWSFTLLVVLLTFLFGRNVIQYILPVSVGILSTLGMMGWLGETVNFFHALCFFIVIGLGLDYTVFHLSGHSNQLRKTVFFSFLTSLTGLGMLAFTSFSVTRSMGISLSFGLFFSYVFSLRKNEKSGLKREKFNSNQWFEQKEQSAGRFRIMILWYLYSLLGKGTVKVISIPIIACIYPFAKPARTALDKFYKIVMAARDRQNLPKIKPPSIFRHLAGFAWSMIDKTDACTLAKNPPRIAFLGNGVKNFLALIEAGKGAMIISSHVGTIEVLPYAKSQTSRNPHVHAFKQLGHNSVFTKILSSKLDNRKLTVHPVEEIGVETAALMKDAIDSGSLVIMAGDRLSAGNSSAHLTRTFLGEKCLFPKGVYVFAKLMESPVFFITCIRTGWNEYQIHVEECQTRLKPGDILNEYVVFLEKETLAYPSEWFHFHDFFASYAER